MYDMNEPQKNYVVLKWQDGKYMHMISLYEILRKNKSIEMESR